VPTVIEVDRHARAAVHRIIFRFVAVLQRPET